MRSCCRQTSSLVARRLRSSRANLILAQLEIRRTSREKPSETLDALGAQPVLNNLFEASERLRAIRGTFHCVD